MSGYLTPIDPVGTPMPVLRARMGALIDNPLLAPQEDPPPGHYRCSLCLRVLAKVRTDEEAVAAAAQRGTLAPDPDEAAWLCEDCDRIIGEDLGYR